MRLRTVTRTAVLVVSAIQAGAWRMTSLAFTVFVLAGLSFAPLAAAAGDPKHGEYVVRLAGCDSCHTDPKKKDARLAGGLALKSPYGTFHVPNITPDPETGIGRWSEVDFIRAMTEGVAPDGRHYYPAFPFTSYTRMTRQDLRDLKAYLDTVRPVRNAVPSHDLRFPYNSRFALGAWKWLFFQPGSFKPEPRKSASWNRGAYLVTGPGHCGECHTARNFLGATNEKLALAGAKEGPDGKGVPNITPHPKKGIGLWSAADMVEFLKTGDLPFGEAAAAPMSDVIANNTSHWTNDDLKSTAQYLLSLPKREAP
jgi:mono/diheme cytochrome c family protein